MASGASGAVYAVQTRDLHKTYRMGETEVPVLVGVELDIAQGEFVSIMGPSGSGKSTLLNMVGLLDTPTLGRIRIMDDDVGGLGRNARARVRRHRVGFIFQAFHLQPRTTALGNVMLPMALAGMPNAQRRPLAMRLLGAVGLEDRAKHRPNELSGGQKQRVAIARALALDPPILLADEPTGNLDSTTSNEIMGLFRRFHRHGKTIIQVTHDRDMADHGDRILHFLDGRVVREQRRGP